MVNQQTDAPAKAAAPAKTPATKAAPADAPVAASQAQQPADAPHWMFGDPPRESAQPANLVFGREGNGRANASGVFRRDGSGEPEGEDRTALLLERGRIAVAKMDHAAVRALAAEKAKLHELLTLCGEKAADVRRRRADPKLLGSLDFSEQVKQLVAEEETIEARRQEADAATARVETQLTWARQRVEADIRAAVGPLPAAMAAELEVRRRELMGEMAKRVGGLLEELLRLGLTERRPPDAGRVVQQLLGEAMSGG